MPDISLLTNRLNGVKMSGKSKGKAFCPSHDDINEQSLSLAQVSNGVLVLHCFAGCKTADVLDDMGLNFRDLFPPR